MGYQSTIVTPVKFPPHLSAAEAQGHFGLFALFAGMDAPASSALTRRRFGWHPAQPGLILDLDAGHYFS